MSPRGGRRPRHGFGMLEIVILLGVAAVIAVLTAAVMMQANRLERVQETWTILERTRLALFDAAATNKAFRQRVGNNAGELSELVTPLSTTDPNSCGGTFGGGARGNWTNWGPFGGFTIDANVGLATPIGIANNTLLRNPANGGGGTGALVIVMPNVDVADATLMDDVFDNANGLAAGVLQWSAPAGGLTTLGYVITIDGTC